MTTLVTSGTGKTGIRLARLVHTAGHRVLPTSRTGVAHPFNVVTFDWTDPTTFENPFKADSNIDKVYLVAPVVLDALPVREPVLQGSVYVGKVHEYLAEHGIEYGVLRPTWFIENFGDFHLSSIREDNAIFSVTKMVSFHSLERTTSRKPLTTPNLPPRVPTQTTTSLGQNYILTRSSSEQDPGKED
ncbi:unnamed protein product [Cyclocybe aegerita]|uniref:NmrA-like domain-containing protein n=1 Tax=Cyclocybe aegerita TaxID=1973307 RepID=A0A8S0WFU2_CYCAE|nr:unnamed protein product [Cyclocybe aegerita]